MVATRRAATSSSPVVVETPTKLTREQKELLKQLESSVGDDGQPKRKSFFDKLKG